MSKEHIAKCDPCFHVGKHFENRKNIKDPVVLNCGAGRFWKTRAKQWNHSGNCQRLAPTGIRLSEVHVGREFDILNVPRVGNLTQPPSWKMEDQGMSDKKSAIFEKTQ